MAKKVKEQKPKVDVKTFVENANKKGDKRNGLRVEFSVKRRQSH